MRGDVMHASGSENQDDQFSTNSELHVLTRLFDLPVLKPLSVSQSVCLSVISYQFPLCHHRVGLECAYRMDREQTNWSITSSPSCVSWDVD
jgi:hypothetical protein